MVFCAEFDESDNGCGPMFPGSDDDWMCFVSKITRSDAWHVTLFTPQATDLFPLGLLIGLSNRSKESLCVYHLLCSVKSSCHIFLQSMIDTIGRGQKHMHDKAHRRQPASLCCRISRDSGN